MAMMGLVSQHHFGGAVVQLPKNLPRFNLAAIILPILALILIFGLNPGRLMAGWYANLGAVQMSQAELKDFPTNEWATSEIVPDLETAASTLQSALQFDPQNQTANYRLGLISMLRQDFESAVANLEIAYRQAPDHRGTIKSLGYCYVWLGDMDKAQALLGQIPEAQHEMEVYMWWWETQGRPDLSERASRMIPYLDPVSH
jgi:lipopolysaccharide biosynthesis regulator YciM